MMDTEAMEMIMDFKPDILCEDHFDIFQPNDAVYRYIRRCQSQNA